MSGKPELKDGKARFHTQTSEEHQFVSQHGMAPRYKSYLCGACGSSTNGRVLCDIRRPVDSSLVSWMVCGCEQMEPTVIVIAPNENTTQIPVAAQFPQGRRLAH